jgi:hypothetical protein
MILALQTVEGEAAFEVFMIVKIYVQIFRVVTPCSVEVGYQLFRGPYCLHLHFTLNMEAAWYSETFKSFHNSIRRHNSYDIDFNL